MRYDPEKHHRRSARLKDYDYAQEGAYVVTLCTFERACTLGEINDDGVMTLSAWGRIVHDEWQRTPIVRPYVDLDAFVVMPNHFHGIVVITESQRNGHPVGAQRAAPLRSKTFARVEPGSLGAIVRGFKSNVTKRINELRQTPQAPVWQRNYYDNIIRSETMLNQFRFYIEHTQAISRR